MAGWKFTPKTLGGIDINDATYLSFHVFRDGAMTLGSRTPVELDIPGDYSFPEVARSQPGSTTIELHITLKVITQAALDALRRVCDRFQGDITYIVEDDNAVEWSTLVRVTRLVEVDAVRFVAMLYLSRPIFEKAQSTDGPRTISATPTAFNLSPTVGGTVRTYPEFTITPTVAKAAAADYRFRYPVLIAWRSELPGEDTMGNGYPIDVANDALDTATEVAATRMLASGDDLRVFVDGVEFPRALDGMNGATTKVWTAIHFSPEKHALVQISTLGIPATGGEWSVEEGQSLSEWPERGVFMVDNEAVWYGARTDTKFQQIERGYRGTTAVGHSANELAQWVEHDIELVYGWSSAPAPTAALLAISTSASTNLAHTYNGFFVSPKAQRYGQMRGLYTEDNIKSPALSYIELGGKAFLVDSLPGGALYPYNNFDLYVPCGVKDAASAVAFDMGNGFIASDINAGLVLDARLFGVDIATGVESLLGSYDFESRVTSAKTVTPTAVLQRLRWNALYKCITGAYRSLVTVDKVIGTANDEIMQRWALTEDAGVTAIAIYAKESAAGDTCDIQLHLCLATGATPEPRDTVLLLGILNAEFSTAYKWRAAYFTTVSPAVIAANAAYDLVARETAGAGIIHWGSYNCVYAGGEAWDETASVWARRPEGDRGFLILGDGSHIQPEAPSGMGGAMELDNTVVTFDDTTPRTPFYFRSPRENIYPIRGVISHNGTGLEIPIFYIAELNTTLIIRTKTKEVIINEARSQYAPWAVEPDDLEQWMYLRGTNVAADNNISYAEVAGIGTVELTTKWQDAWA